VVTQVSVFQHEITIERAVNKGQVEFNKHTALAESATRDLVEISKFI